MKEGDRVRIKGGLHQGKEGQITSVSKLSSECRDLYRVELSVNDWSYFYDDEIEMLSPIMTKQSSNANGCECGSWVVSSPRHQPYCRLFREEEKE